MPCRAPGSGERRFGRCPLGGTPPLLIACPSRHRSPNEEMPTPRSAPFLARALAWSLVAGGIGGAAEPPKIAKPRPAPPSTGAMAPLPPAVIDDSLAIGGDDVKAREEETRLSVEVLVNGRGPYLFIVDSG